MENFSLVRCDSDNPDFRSLVALLDAELRVFDGEEHTFYAQYNKLDKISHCLVGYLDNIPVGCGALREIDVKTIEVKRMYTKESARGKGVASRILAALEDWAKELGYDFCVLETGKKQEAAVRLYPKCGYEIIPNYGPYIGVENSICMKKGLN
ncbi:GNAT family N-acetyltransferase [Flavobacterium silvaticum]|uniref:GNAT family N-acetyltransferase n=1 Tax=Flavobacterium silvaticum TaxID=1852020 RepID=A0A972JI49_9FLAO|nr:GNAT family N-acetyltransferase [Flavobacterium silvaticum]NMH26937.1 GNAT family N-acetyltransferase [Flavobacterium silvaticum]